MVQLVPLTMDVYAFPKHHMASVRAGSSFSACSSLAIAYDSTELMVSGSIHADDTALQARQD